MNSVSTCACPAGAGGFGAIYTVPTTPDLALKVVKNEEHSTDLAEEFRMMCSSFVYCSSRDQLFQIPVPFGCLPKAAGRSENLIAGTLWHYSFAEINAVFNEL